MSTWTAPSGITVESCLPRPQRSLWDYPVTYAVCSYAMWARKIMGDSK